MNSAEVQIRRFLNARRGRGGREAHVATRDRSELILLRPWRPDQAAWPIRPR